MPDASRLIEYAEKHGYVWRWKTRPKGGKWEALTQLDPQDGSPKPIFTSGLVDDEQAALDRAIDHAIHQDQWRRRPAGTSACDLGTWD